jgi:hypothetical protein
MTRLTDDQIQQYLDGTLSGEMRAEVNRLLAVDPENRRLLEEYQELFGILGEREVHSLASEFIPQVLAERGRLLEPAWKRLAWYGALGALTVAAVMIGSLFIEFQALLHTLAGWYSPWVTESSEMWLDIRALFVGHGPELAFVCAAGAILLLFQSLDKILIESKYRRTLR